MAHWGPIARLVDRAVIMIIMIMVVKASSPLVPYHASTRTGQYHTNPTRSGSWLWGFFPAFPNSNTSQLILLDHSQFIGHMHLDTCYRAGADQLDFHEAEALQRFGQGRFKDMGVPLHILLNTPLLTEPFLGSADTNC